MEYGFELLTETNRESLIKHKAQNAMRHFIGIEDEKLICLME